jgi:PHD/YefM family antitoxin component YafN of YafNO toxin-antitoxin module
MKAPGIRVANDELVTVREVMRDLPALLNRLDDRSVDKLVVTQRNQLRAVILSAERWAQIEQQLAVDAPLADLITRIRRHRFT